MRQRTETAGHKQPVAAHSKGWPRRGPEGPVSGDESGPLLGSTRQKAAGYQRQLWSSLFEARSSKFLSYVATSRIEISRAAEVRCARFVLTISGTVATLSDARTLTPVGKGEEGQSIGLATVGGADGPVDALCPF
jgi:hypothetical protein